MAPSYVIIDFILNLRSCPLPIIPLGSHKETKKQKKKTPDLRLIHTKTNTRYLLHSNEGVLLKHPSGKMKQSFGDRSFSVAAPTL